MCYAPWSVLQDGSDMDPKQAMPQTVGAKTRPAYPETSKGLVQPARNADAFSIPSGRRRGHGEGPGRTACIFPQRSTSHGHRATQPSLATDTRRVATSYYGSECIHTAADRMVPGQGGIQATRRPPREATARRQGPLISAGERSADGETEHHRSEFRTTSVFTSSEPVLIS